MCTILRSLVLAACLLVPVGALPAQEPAPAKAEEPKRYERDQSSIIVYYSLALMAVLVILLLVCMPARREE